MLRAAGLSFGLLVAICLTAHADRLLTEQASIDHNPFQRPPSLLAPGTADGAGPTLMGVSTLELKAVLVAGSGSQANINGLVMGLGEEVDGYRLTLVSLDGVELRRDGETVVLRLHRGSEL